MGPDEVVNPEEPQRHDRIDPVLEALIDRDLKEGMGSATVYARKQFEDPQWPIGLCIAWVLSRGELEAAIQLYARHRVGMKVRLVEGWADARATVHLALMEGRIEGLGIRPQDGKRDPIPPHEWIDLRIQQRGPYDEVRGADGSIAFRDVRISAATTRKEWPAATAAQRKAQHNQENESACLNDLKQRMGTRPKDPIAKETLHREFRGVSGRAFKRLYSQAARETGAKAWSAPGRRRATRPD